MIFIFVFVGIIVVWVLVMGILKVGVDESLFMMILFLESVVF